MNDKWTDFEKYVFAEFNKLSTRLSRLEGKAATWGAIAGALAATLGEIALKIFHS